MEVSEIERCAVNDREALEAIADEFDELDVLEATALERDVGQLLIDAGVLTKTEREMKDPGWGIIRWFEFTRV